MRVSIVRDSIRMGREAGNLKGVEGWRGDAGYWMLDTGSGFALRATLDVWDTGY